jgi:excisionase family DNA binding protein
MSAVLPPLAVSVPEAARLLSVGRSTIRAMLKDGRLPYTRIVGRKAGHGRIVIAVAELNSLLASPRCLS